LTPKEEILEELKVLYNNLTRNSEFSVKLAATCNSNEQQEDPKSNAEL
jgi:hypothetical protein